MDKRYFSSGEVLFEEGSRPSVAYVIEEGAVELCKATTHGFSKTVATLGSGNIIGEVALITDSPHSVRAVAKEDGRAMVLTKEDFQARLGKTDKVVAMILKSVTNRLKSTY